MNAQEILDLKKPEDLFGEEEELILKKFRILSLLWHPDKCHDPEANRVFQHIVDLKNLALEIKNRSRRRNLVQFKLQSGKTITIRARHTFSFELGNGFITETHVIYHVLDKFQTFFDNGIRQINNIRSIPNPRLSDEMLSRLPEIKQRLKTTEGSLVILNLPKNYIRLQDIVDKLGLIEARTTAWIMSNLFHLLCFFQIKKIVHGDISPSTYFVNPTNHKGLLLGGWWYATEEGQNFIGLPRRSHEFNIGRKIAQRILDDELVRLTVQEVSANMPEAMRAWCKDIGKTNAIINYETWINKILPESFGSRKFIEWKLSFHEIYSGE